MIIFSLYLCSGKVRRHHFKLSKMHWFLLTIQGLCGGLFFNLFLIMGLKYTSASMAGMVISLLPAVIAILAMVVFKEKLSGWQKLGILVALIGLIIINGGQGSLSFSGHSSELVGFAFVFLALLPEASYCLISKKYNNQQPLLVFSGILNAVNVIGLLPFILMYSHSTPLIVDKASIEILFFTGIASALFYISWSQGIKHVSASKGGIFTALGPLLTVLVAWITLGESINFYQSIGMVLVVTSILLSNVQDIKLSSFNRAT